MKTTADELKRRAQVLPLGFEKYVLSHTLNTAKVKSFSSEKVWDVDIKPDGGASLTFPAPAQPGRRIYVTTS